MDSLIPLLVGLIDGTRPLPSPHPQRLAFTKDPAAIRQLADAADHIVDQSGRSLTELEMRQLLFKLASWCGRRGRVDPTVLASELDGLVLPVSMTLSARPTWVGSRGGVGNARRWFDQWWREADKLARQNEAKPLRVCDVDWSGFYIVELTSAAHVQQEGYALGHCMWWSVNNDVLARKGFPEGAEALECLTYAIKIRTGELRIFSVRDPDGQPHLTITYDPKRERLAWMEGKEGTPLRGREWGSLRCDALAALARIVPVKRTFSGVACILPCVRRPWCEKQFSFEEDNIAEAHERHRARRAAQELMQNPDRSAV